MAEEKPTKSDATGSPTEKFNLKLFLLMSAVYIGITFLLVNTLGLIVAGIVFAAMRKGRGSREALLFSLLAGIGNFFNEFYKLNGIFTARDLSISVLSGLFFALTAFGAVELIGFIGSKFRNKK